MQVSNLKECEEWGLFGGMAAVPTAPKVLEVRQGGVAVVPRRRMVLPLDDGVVVGRPVGKKVVAGTVVLFNNIRSWHSIIVE